MQHSDHWDWGSAHKAIPFSPWKGQFEWVEAPQASPDGEAVAAIGNQNGAYHIIVDDSVWPQAFDMAWPPVFSPDGRQGRNSSSR